MSVVGGEQRPWSRRKIAMGEKEKHGRKLGLYLPIDPDLVLVNLVVSCMDSTSSRR